MLRLAKTLARHLLPWTVRRAWYCLRAAQGKGRCPCAKPAPPAKPVRKDGIYRPAVPGGDSHPIVHLVALGAPSSRVVAMLDALDDVGRFGQDHRVVLTTDDTGFKQLPLDRVVVDQVMAEEEYRRVHPDGDWNAYLHRRLRQTAERYRPEVTIPVEPTATALSAVGALRRP